MMKKSLQVLAGLVVGTSMMTSTAYADCGEVSISEMNWASARLVTSVSKTLMETGYGCTVNVIPTSTLPAILSVKETGKPDIVTNLWISNVPQLSELEKQGKVSTVNKVISDGGSNGWWIPSHLLQRYPQLEKIEGVLSDPALVGGKFHNAPGDWGVRVMNDHLIKAFEFSKHGMEVLNHESGKTLDSAIATANQEAKAIFSYYWTPSALIGKYDMVKVNLGPFNKETHDCIAVKDCKNPGKTSFETSDIVTVVTSDFATREPEIVELLKNISFSSQEMSVLLAWQAETNASPEETAKFFFMTQRKKWAEWLTEDALNKVSAAL